MTDQDPPTTLPDVYSVGQRRAPGGTFPSGGGGGGSTGLGDTDYDQVGEEDPLSPDGNETHPCDDPETALEWNADAAAAEAIRKFRLKAAELGDEDLYEREFHAFLYRDSMGRIQVGEVTPGERVGSTEESTVGRDWTGVTPDNLIGSIHSHPGGTLAPTGTDWIGFDIIQGWVNQFAGTQRANEYRQYIVARDTDNPDSIFLPRVYDETSPRSDAAGPEVNPDAVPCP